MSETPAPRRGLPAEAYRTMDGHDYRPWVPAEEQGMAEFTLQAVMLGAALGVLFSAANAYLGLKVGMTVTASIPVSVISMAILRGLLKRGTILENNMAQTVGSSGESLAAGVIFTIPALILLGQAPAMSTVFFIAALGGLMGILMMVPLRRWLIVREHGALPYPEGTGCAEVLAAGELGGQRAKPVFLGLVTGFLYKLGMDKHAFGLWSDAPEWSLSRLKTAVGMDALPSLLGVGFIIGPRIAALMLAGGMLAWMVLIPLISLLGSGLPEALYPASVPISELDHWGVWRSYVRYIGAGAVTVGGLISLGRNLPVMVASLGRWVAQLRTPRGQRQVAATLPRTQRDLPLAVVIGGSLLCATVLWMLPAMPVSFLGALLVVVFTFFFTVVASRVVGLVGGSSLPVSGMTIAALLGTSLVFVAVGFEGMAAKVAALTVGAVVCVGISTAGDISQDLKTGFLLGATPRRQQLGEMIGVLTSAVFIGGFVFLLHEAFGIGSRELPAPQATLMKLVVDGVLDGNLPWTLVIAGGAVAVVVELLGAPSLPFAVGLYLPLSLSTPVMLGGLLRGFLDRRRGMDDEARAAARQRGVLLASGLIAGEAVLGLFLAGFIVVVSRHELGWSLALPHPWGATGEAWIGFLGLLALAVWFLRSVLSAKNS
jgi:putative OPT family oligopeptide transporter